MSPLTPNDDGHTNRSDIIELQVGQQRFTALRSTLTEQSTNFKSLLSGRWNSARSDGSYFVDADPDLFAHILNYLRRPDVYPIFYDDVKGHDYLKYHALLSEARYFGIDALAK
ncbi:BTB/POZ protein [Aspergillus carlsbadensis]|nr:BTB/POZ protein [Aspergillus carlsbadensis]